MPRLRHVVLGLLLPSLGACALILPREHAREGTRVELSFPSDTESGRPYRWVQESGPAVELHGADSPEAWFVAPQASESYRLVFSRLSEEGGDAVSRAFGVYVVAEDDPPRSEAGETVYAGENEPVVLRGSGTDPEGGAVGLAWRQTAGPRVVLNDADRAEAHFQAPQVTERTYLRFELAVTDRSEQVTVDEVSVVVDPVDSPPTLFVDPEVTVREGERVLLEARGVDPEGADVAYVWSARAGGPAVRLSDETGPTPGFLAPPCPEGVDSYALAFDVTATDGINVSKSERVVVTVVADVGVPVAEAGDDLRIKEGERVRLMGRASHPRGRELAYAWRQAAGDVPLEIGEADTLTPWFVAPEVPHGARAIEAVLELSVTDGEHHARDRVNVRIEPTFAPREKRRALQPGETDRLLAFEGDELPRWIRAKLAGPEDGRGFFATGEETLEARFSRGAGSIACDLPPGSWCLEGTLRLNAVDHGDDPSPEAGRGVRLRFETAEGEACALGALTLGQELGIQVRRMDRDLYTGEWQVTEAPPRLLDELGLQETLHFRVAWSPLHLSIRWSLDPRALAQAEPHEVELARSPELLTLTVERSRAALTHLRLVGATQ